MISEPLGMALGSGLSLGEMRKRSKHTCKKKRAGEECGRVLRGRRLAVGVAREDLRQALSAFELLANAVGWQGDVLTSKHTRSKHTW